LSRFSLASRATAVLGVLSAYNQISIQNGAKRRAASAAPAREPESTPVLLIPGILGTAMVDPTYRNFPVWGSYRGSFFYRRKYDDLDLSILPGKENRLQPGGILWKFTIAPGLIDLPVYENFKQSLLYAGYEMGNLDRPVVRRGLYALQYDWRCDIVAGAKAVAKAVSALRNSLGVEKVHLVGHSWGCVISRYYLRYGDADMLADSPEEPRPGASAVDTFFAVAPPFGGTLRAFYSLHHGYSPGVSLGRPVSPHHVASSPAAYQLLRYDPNLLVDERGRKVPWDLMDPITWKRFHLGPYRPGSFEALLTRAREHNPELKREEMEAGIESFLEICLRRARRLGEMLSQPSIQERGLRTVTYTSRNRSTLFKLVLSPGSGSSQLLSTEKQVRRQFPDLVPRVIAPGDEHVTFRDIMRHSNHQTVVTDAHEVPGDSYVLATDSRSHRDLFNTDAVLTNLLLNVRHGR
jgi:pimeloyl-ACP methyl ester carboxylesterase